MAGTHVNIGWSWHLVDVEFAETTIGKFEPAGFDLRLGLKDAKLALAAGEDVNVPLPFASVLRDNYLDALAHGDESKDWSAMSRVALRRAGLEG